MWHTSFFKNIGVRCADMRHIAWFSVEDSRSRIAISPKLCFQFPERQEVQQRQKSKLKGEDEFQERASERRGERKDLGEL